MSGKSFALTSKIFFREEKEEDSSRYLMLYVFVPKFYSRYSDIIFGGRTAKSPVSIMSTYDFKSEHRMTPDQQKKFSSDRM